MVPILVCIVFFAMYWCNDS